MVQRLQEVVLQKQRLETCFFFEKKSGEKEKQGGM